METQQPVDDIEYPERPTPAFQHKKAGGGRKRIALIAGAAVGGLLLIAGGVYWFLWRQPPAPAQPVKASSEAQTMTTAESSEPVTFKSAKLGMELTYRKDWQLRESADKSEMTLTSPKTAYARLDGTSTEGVFTLKLRHGVIPDPMSATVQKAVAVRDSVVIAYTQPTAAQRQYTNVTYAGTDANTFNFFIVSGGADFKAGATVGSGIDLIGDVYLIAGGYGADAGDALVFDPAAKSAMDSAVFQQAMDVVKSLKID